MISIVNYGFYPGNIYLVTTYGFGGFGEPTVRLSFTLSINRIIEAELVR